MTYRERRQRKAERLREWADKRRAKSAAAFKGARKRLDCIPLGQPILVGHHSEKRHRRDLARIDGGFARGFEHERKANEMESRAANIEDAADRAIYSDDPDAVEQLEARIAALEAQRDRAKAINKAIRKGPGWEAHLSPPLTDDERREIEINLKFAPGFGKLGYPSFHFSNLSGNIARQRKRLEQLRPVAGQRARVREVLDAERAEYERQENAAAAEVPRQDATPAEAVQILEELHAMTSADAPPLAEVPFSLAAEPVKVSKPQGRLF